MSIQSFTKSSYIVPISIVVFVLIAMLLGSKASLLYPFNDGTDPNVYTTIGKGWLQGLTPYRDLFDHKGPLLYIIYAISRILSPNSYFGLYMIEVICFLVILYYVYKSSRLYLNQQFSLFIILIFSVIFFSKNEARPSAEEIILIFQAIGLYLLLSFFTGKSKISIKKFFFFQGLLIGCVFCIKFNLIIFWFFPLIIILFQVLKEYGIKKVITSIILTILGIMSICVPFVIYFWCVEALPDFIESYFHFNLLYASHSFSLDNFIEIQQKVIKANFFFLLFTIFGIIYSIYNIPLKKRIYQLAIPITFIIMYYILFNRVSYNYYIISLCIFSVPSLIATMKYIQDKFKVINYKKNFIAVYFTALACILIINIKSISKRNNYCPTLDFANYILTKYPNKDFDILTLDLDRGLCFSTQTLPKFKYFYQPAIKHSQYPIVIDSQIAYMSSKTPPRFIYFRKDIRLERSLELSEEQKLIEKILTERYKVSKEYADYSVWPTCVQYLFELKD